MVDPGYEKIGLPPEDPLEAEKNAVGRCARDLVAALVDLVGGDPLADGERVAARALLGRRSDDEELPQPVATRAGGIWIPFAS